MQEVFEKIIEKLEAEKKDAERLFDGGSRIIGFQKAIEIVKQVEAEYKDGHFGCNWNDEHEKCIDCPIKTMCKNYGKIWFGEKVENDGWISIGQFPDEPCLLCFESGHMVVGYYDFDTDEWRVFKADGFEIDLTEDDLEDGEPIAWQPLPEPYKEGEHNETD